MLTVPKGRPARLREGGWGARVFLERAADHETVAAELVDTPITIETRSGKTWSAIIDDVVWVGREQDGEIPCLVRTRRPQEQEPGRRPGADGTGAVAARKQEEPAPAGAPAGPPLPFGEIPPDGLDDVPPPTEAPDGPGEDEPPF